MKKNVLGVALLLCLGMILYSCSKQEDFSNLEEEEIIIEDPEIVSALLVRSRSLRDQVIEFTVVDENGDDVTSPITFYVDGTAISDNTYSSSSEGSFEVYGEYDVDGVMVTTDTMPFEVIIPKRKIVVEDYTGTWCGYCPRIAAAIDLVHDDTDDITVVSIHNDDDMALPFEADLRAEFEVFGFPSGRLNRTENWSNPHPASTVIDMAGVETNIAISIRSQVSGSSMAAEVTVVSESNLEDTKLVLYLVEDGILDDQTNYFNADNTSPYFGLGNPIPNFEHKDVLRASLTGILGDAIPATGALQEYKATFSSSLDTSFVTANLKLVAMVVGADNSALNSQYAHVNEVEDYE